MKGRSLVCFALLALVTSATYGQEVTLPLDRYEKLHARAHPAPTPTPAPVVGFSLDEAWLEIHVGDESARVVQELRMVLLSDDWQEIPLAAAGTFIAADLGGLEGRVTTGTGWTLTMRGRGRHQVRLESLLPLASNEEATRPTWSLALEVPHAAVARGVIKVSDAVENAEIVSGAIWRNRGQASGWRFVADPGTTLRARLLGKAVRPERSTLPLRFSVVTGNLLEISRTRVRLTSHLGLTVIQGSLEQLEVPLPPGFEVITLGGDEVAGWNVEDRKLLITPLTAVEGSLELRVDLSSEAGDHLNSLLLVPEQAWQVLAATAVKVEGDGLLELVERGSGRLPDNRERARLPQQITGASSYAMVVPDLAQPPRWQVTWPDSTEVLAAQVDRVVVDVMAGEAGSAAYQVWLKVRSTGATSLTVSVPPGFELVTAGRDRTPLLPGVAGDDLALPLIASASSQVVHLAGLIPMQIPADGTLSVPVPALSAPVSRVEVRVLLPGGRSYTVSNRAQQGSVSSPPQATSEANVSGKRAQLVAQTGVATSRGGYQPRMFSAPAGAIKVEASWSALSSQPDPVTISVKPRSERKEWF
jgi:hypothetical protein